MRRILAVLLVLGYASIAAAQARYYPDRFDWERRTPAQAALDAAGIDAAIKFAIANENPEPKDLLLAHAQRIGGSEPFDAPIGPMKPRAALNGLIVKNGYVVAEWGDTRAVDMTFSVTKTFLSTVVGLAWQKGLIRDVTDKARDYMPPGVDLFDDPHNQPITWEQGHGAPCPYDRERGPGTGAGILRWMYSCSVGARAPTQAPFDKDTGS